MRLIAMLRAGEISAGQFVSMPGLVELLGLPLAAIRTLRWWGVGM